MTSVTGATQAPHDLRGSPCAERHGSTRPYNRHSPEDTRAQNQNQKQEQNAAPRP
ncbi:hypothetical protein GCM10010207_43370 [Streptomyces atratus]|nr:hypothetical protein GCM10010207_43370 [Streptomyces atratus]